MEKNSVNITRVRVLISLIILLGYFFLLFGMVIIESSDALNMEPGENSFMDIVKILIGVLTAIVAKIVYYWFDPNSHENDGMQQGFEWSEKVLERAKDGED